MTPHNDFFLDAGPSVPPPLLPPSPVLSDALPSYPPPAAGLDMGEAEPWGASRHRRPPPGGPQAASRAACLRGLLAADARASRYPHSPHRSGPHAGATGLAPVATRQR